MSRMNEDIKEHLRQIRKRDLFYTYFYATAPKLFGAPDVGGRVMVAPTATRSPALQTRSPGSVEEFAEDDTVRDYRRWLRERRALRQTLTSIGDLARWMDSKPTLSELECSVLEREIKSKNRNGSDQTGLCFVPRSPAQQAPGQADSLVLTMRQGTWPLLLPGTKYDGKPLFNQEIEEKSIIHQHQQHKKKKDQEVVTNMHMQLGNVAHHSHCLPSTLGGYSSKAVDTYRQQGLREHLGVLDKCQAQEIVVNQAVVERVLLHPGDHDLNSCSRLRQPGGWLCRNGGQRAGTEEDKMMATKHIFHKHRTKRHSKRHHADFNAFWPGHEDHVRLYLPQVGIPSQHVLFQHIRHNPVPSPACWPINEKGYYTSGNIDGNKTYTLF